MRSSGFASWEGDRGRGSAAPRRSRSFVRLRPVPYDVEFPDGFISLDELLLRVLTPDDENRLPDARREFAAGRKLRGRANGLADLRLSQGLTQQQLADRAKVSQPRLSLWESRKEKPTVEHVIVLATALGTDCNAIISALFND